MTKISLTRMCELAAQKGARDAQARIEELEAENTRLKLALGQIQRRESPDAGKPWSEYGAFGENNPPVGERTCR